MQRVKELDSIRGLAAIAIVVFHLSWVRVELLGTAIYLFFVLSGYLITSILLRHPPSPEFLLAFYARRGLRIWPIYYLAVLALAAINPWTPTPASLATLPQYLTFTQLAGYYWSDAPPSSIPALGHTWSLAVEEQFYILWPALLIVLRRRGVAGAAMAVIAAAVAMRALGYSRWILATNCDGLALGALLAALLQGRTQQEARALYARRFTAIGLLAAAYWVAGALLLQALPDGRAGSVALAILPTRVLALNLVYFAAVGLVVVFAGHRRLSALRDPRLAYLGAISYGLYLYHYIVYHYFDDYVARAGLVPGLGYDLAKVATSVAIAAVSYRLVELPVLSLKRLVPYPDAGRKEADLPPALLPLTAAEKG
jgi:peptidoglycan/LPS O-acetylase OafA/YrhL